MAGPEDRLANFLDQRGQTLDSPEARLSAALDQRTGSPATASPTTAKLTADVIAPPTGGPTIFQRAADVIVPRDPTQLMLPRQILEGFKDPEVTGAAAGGLLPTVLQMIPPTSAFGTAANNPAGRALGSGIGAGVGAVVKGEDPIPAFLRGSGYALGGEILGGTGSKVVRSLPSIKGRIAENQAQNVTGAIRQVAPELADAVEGARAGVQPTLKGGRTAAAMQEAALGESGQNAIQAAFERGMTQVDQLAPGAFVNGPSLQQAYTAMPQLARDRLVGQVGPQGFTPRQAQEVIAWVGSQAFTESPLGQGVGKIPQQMVWRDALNETVTGLPPAAGQKFLEIRTPYAAGQSYLDVLRGGNAFQGAPNRIALNENALRQYLSDNRMELTQKLGPQGYQALTEALGGAQPGTRSFLASGQGGMRDALMSWLRGTNTGSTQVLRVPTATLAPNVGSQYTGRAPFSFHPALQAVLDAAAQRGGAAVSGQR